MELAYKMTKQLAFVVYGALLSVVMPVCGISSWNQADPYPVYAAFYPHPDDWLIMREKLHMKGYEPERRCNEKFRFALSAYGQSASSGLNSARIPQATLVDGVKVGIGKDIDQRPRDLPCLAGNWNMLALLYGPLPAGATLPPTLAAARAALFPAVPAGVPINETDAIDAMGRFACFTIPLQYHKKGLRFELAAQVWGDFGIEVQGGLADIEQSLVNFLDLSCIATTTCSAGGPGGPFANNLSNPAITLASVEQYLMRPYQQIMTEIGLDILDFHKVTPEDFRVLGYWRHNFLINAGHTGECDPLFILTPFAALEGCIAAANRRDPNKAFAISAGNNKHNSIGGTAGLMLDFADTIEIGGEVSGTHFSSEKVCGFRMPNSPYQSSIFPFTTDVNYSPGMNWNFIATMNAWHFLGCLSFYFQYVIVHHTDDKICLLKPDPAFDPKLLERESTWKMQLANCSFNYDISPDISLGFLWQAPLSQRNGYKTTTLMATFNMVY